MRQTGNRPITLPTQEYADFKKMFRSIPTQGPQMIDPTKPTPVNGTRHLIANVNMDLYNGLEIDGGKHGRVQGSTLINFGTTSRMDPDLQAMLYKDAGISDADAAKLIQKTASTYKEGRKGNTGINPETQAPYATPVAIDAFEDMSSGTVKVRTIIDCQALANANYDDAKAERLANPSKFAGVREPNPEVEKNLRNMMPVTVRFGTTTNGIGSMNADRAKQNTARVAAQTALMTKGAGGSMVTFSKDEVASVGQTINDVYSSFLKELAADPSKAYAGAGMAARDKDGKVIPGKFKGTVPGTEFPSLNDLGLAVLEVDGATVLAVTSTDPSKNDLRMKSMPAMNAAVNAKLSQAFNSVPTMSRADVAKLPRADRAAEQSKLTVKNLGNSMAIQMYQTTPKSVQDAFTLVNPSIQGTFSAFGNMVRDTVECAQHKHDGMDSPAAKQAAERGEQYLSKTIEQIYGAETLSNVRQIMADAGIETSSSELAKETSPEKVAEAKAASQAFNDKCRETAQAQGVELVAFEK